MKTISLKHAATTALTAGGVAALVFLMLEVVWADLLREYFASFPDPLAAAALILFIGLVVGAGIHVGASLLVASSMRNVSPINLLPAVLLALLSNLIAWMVVPAVWVMIYHPNVLAGLSFTGKMASIVQVQATFALYALPSPVYAWMLQVATYSMFFFLFMKIVVPDAGRRLRK